MAKKVGTTRVHQIAKELGVTSKDIVKKCDDEGIPSVTNHMSTLSAGLAATIREWFASSESNVATAVQTSAPVDVDKARKKAKKKARKKPIKDEPETPAVVDQVPEAPPAFESAPTGSPVPLPEVPPAVGTPIPPTPVEPPATVVADSSAAPAPENAPRGRKLEQPVKTKLAGPKVIRVETPDIVPKPRSASRGDGPGRGGPGRGGPRPGAGPRPGGPSGPGAAPPGPLPTDDKRSSRRNKRRSGAARQEPARPTTGRGSQQEASRPGQLASAGPLGA